VDADRDEDLTPQVASWVVTDVGLEAVALATELLDRRDAVPDDSATTMLTIVTELRRHVPDPDRAAAVLQLATARVRARGRFAHADSLLFTRAGLEQASDPLVAAWRARRYLGADGADVWDLCAGVGSDALSLGRVASPLTLVELSAARAALLRHNLAVSGIDAEVLTGDALEVRPPAQAWLHADPGRRRGERRVRRLGAMLPPVDTLLATHRDAPAIGVVVGPALDWDDPALPEDAEVEFIQRGDQLVEAVLWLGALRGAGDDDGGDGRSGDGRGAGDDHRGGGGTGFAVGRHVRATATLLPDIRLGGTELVTPIATATRAAGQRAAPLAVGPLGSQLVEAVPAAVRARLHDHLVAALAGEGHAVRRVARRRALLTSDGTLPASPWYRARPIVTVLPARPKAVRAWLRTADPGPVELVLHGVDVDVDTWWRGLGRPPRGPQGVRIELVRRDDDTIAIVTTAEP
jgi:hypothetical protein